MGEGAAFCPMGETLEWFFLTKQTDQLVKLFAAIFITSLHKKTH
jgi:hypothetical protein